MLNTKKLKKKRNILSKTQIVCLKQLYNDTNERYQNKPIENKYFKNPEYKKEVKFLSEKTNLSEKAIRKWMCNRLHKNKVIESLDY
jgi:hypothetical protein